MRLRGLGLGRRRTRFSWSFWNVSCVGAANLAGRCAFRGAAARRLRRQRPNVRYRTFPLNSPGRRDLNCRRLGLAKWHLRVPGRIPHNVPPLCAAPIVGRREVLTTPTQIRRNFALTLRQSRRVPRRRRVRKLTGFSRDFANCVLSSLWRIRHGCQAPAEIRSERHFSPRSARAKHSQVPQERDHLFTG